MQRREFLRFAAIGAAAAWTRASFGAVAFNRDEGVTAPAVHPWLRDSLKLDGANAAALTIDTRLPMPARCGRRDEGWSVDGGLPDAYTRVMAREVVDAGRSLFAELSFRSTQIGVADNAHGLVELWFGNVANSAGRLGVRVENGVFHFLDPECAGPSGGKSAIGSSRPVFQFSQGKTYTLQIWSSPGIFSARLIEAVLPEVGTDRRAVRGVGPRSISRRDVTWSEIAARPAAPPYLLAELTRASSRRSFPFRPGFGLGSNPQATGGALTAFDWSVTSSG